jgi:metallo-beta-lactamase family protein
VLLTHAHLDHSGALPLLVRQGYRGPVFATQATIDLCALLLPDSGRIQEEDAAYANRHGISKHKPALPLYTEADAQAALRQLRPIGFAQRTAVAAGIEASWHAAGHILGASSIELRIGGRTVLFSGDIGRPDDLLMRPPEPIVTADVVVVESTYGDRQHEAHDSEGALGEAIVRTVGRGGSVIVPAFAVGRAQLLLYMLHRLKRSGAIPDLPVFLDSPMAADTTAIYHRHRSEHRLSVEQCDGMCHVAQIVDSAEQSRAVTNLRVPAVVVSASGMATGGRVLHHLKARLPDPRNTVVLAGYQAGGTRGARLQAGERSVRIHGEDVAVNAEIVSLHGLSAHADAAQLMQWLSGASRAPRRAFITHGEPGPADALRQRIQQTQRWDCRVPKLRETVDHPT